MPLSATSVVPVGGGFLQVKPEAFHSDFAADVPKGVAEFMAISQVTIAADIFGAKATVAAWKPKPSFAVVTTEDRIRSIPTSCGSWRRAPNPRRSSSRVATRSSFHVQEVAALIEKAAKAAE